MGVSPPHRFHRRLQRHVFPQFILGSRGMPRRERSVTDQASPVSTGSVRPARWSSEAVCSCLREFWSIRWCEDVGAGQSLGGGTLEWKCSSPPPHHNFDWPPVVTDPYYYDNLFYDPGQQGYIEVEEVQDEPFEHEVVLFDFEI